MAELAYFKGPGGVVWKMSLPLPGPIAQQVAKQTLTRCNEDGSPWREPAEPAPATSTPEPVTSKPAVNAGKDLWVAWAVHCGADRAEAEAMTKVALVDAYTPKDDQPPTQPATPTPAPEGGDQ